MNVLVTGATGFIGNFVVQELLKRGCAVIATSTSTLKAKEKKWFRDVVFIEHDIYTVSSENLFKKFNAPDLAIHLAWGDLRNLKDASHIEEILPKHKEFLHNLIANGLKDLTVSGTCLEYGMVEGELSEEMEPHPSSAYPIAKDLLRHYLLDLKQQHSFSLKWLRLFYMYGEGQTQKAIIPLLQKALLDKEPEFKMSGGEQVRDYLPVTEVADYTVTLALQKEHEGVINCCSNVPVTIKQLITDYLEKHGASIPLNLGFYPYPDYEPFKFWGSNKKQMEIIHSSRKKLTNT